MKRPLIVLAGPTAVGKSELSIALAKQIAAAQTTVLPFVIAGVFYYIFNFVVAWVMEWFEKKMNYYH